MKNCTHSDAFQATICQLIVVIADRLDQSAINTNAAVKLANRGKTVAALSALMDVEPDAHDALDLFRAAMALRAHLLSLPEPKSRR